MNYKSFPVRSASFYYKNRPFMLSEEAIAVIFRHAKSWITVDWEGRATGVSKKSEINKNNLPDIMAPSDKDGFSVFGLSKSGQVIIGCRFNQESQVIRCFPLLKCDTLPEPTLEKVISLLEIILSQVSEGKEILKQEIHCLTMDLEKIKSQVA